MIKTGYGLHHVAQPCFAHKLGHLCHELIPTLRSAFFPGGFAEKSAAVSTTSTGTADISDIKTRAESKMIGMNHECK